MTNLNLDALPKRGDTFVFKLRGAEFYMTIENARIRYGQVDVLITPVAGKGSFWVRYESTPVTEVVKKEEALAY